MNCAPKSSGRSDSLQFRNRVLAHLACGLAGGRERLGFDARTGRFLTETGGWAVANQNAIYPLAKREDETDAEWRARLTPDQKTELKAWRKAHSWHPHQFRHNAATFIRKEFTLETARIILGHHSAAITEVYAERDEQEAISAIAKVG